MLPLVKYEKDFANATANWWRPYCALDPESHDFLHVKKVKPLLDLSNADFVKAEFSVACQFLQTEMFTALKHGLNFVESTVTCEN